MGKDIAIREQHELTARVDQPMELSVEDLKNQVEKILRLQREVLREDIHWGQIPGTDKPTLYKPGAEKLCLVFRLKPSYQILEPRKLQGEHREREVICALTHIPTDLVLAEGVGSCSTMESKYRWRRPDPEPTGRPVPVTYWNLRKANPTKARELLGGKDFVAKKIDGMWLICRRSEERIENPDIADHFNTILKMAKKRALVDATLAATAASDVFAVEELEDDEDEQPEAKQPAAARAETTTEQAELTFKQALEAALMKRCGNDKKRAVEILKRLTGQISYEGLSEEQARSALLWFEQKEAGEARDPPK